MELELDSESETRTFNRKQYDFSIKKKVVEFNHTSELHMVWWSIWFVLPVVRFQVK